MALDWGSPGFFQEIMDILSSPRRGTGAKLYTRGVSTRLYSSPPTTSTNWVYIKDLWQTEEARRGERGYILHHIDSYKIHVGAEYRLHSRQF